MKKVKNKIFLSFDLEDAIRANVHIHTRVVR